MGSWLTRTRRALGPEDAEVKRRGCVRALEQLTVHTTGDSDAGDWTSGGGAAGLSAGVFAGESVSAPTWKTEEGETMSSG